MWLANGCAMKRCARRATRRSKRDAGSATSGLSASPREARDHGVARRRLVKFTKKRPLAAAVGRKRQAEQAAFAAAADRPAQVEERRRRTPSGAITRTRPSCPTSRNVPGASGSSTNPTVGPSARTTRSSRSCAGAALAAPRTSATATAELNGDHRIAGTSCHRSTPGTPTPASGIADDAPAARWPGRMQLVRRSPGRTAGVARRRTGWAPAGLFSWSRRRRAGWTPSTARDPYRTEGHQRAVSSVRSGPGGGGSGCLTNSQMGI